MENLFGSQLQGKQGEIPISSLDSVKYVLVYFSAHWCPPCKGFTPKLAMFYDEVNASQKQLEVIYVSADRTAEQFNEYFSEMPWVAVPFSDHPKRNSLAQTFKVQGIPALYLIDKQGNVKKDTARMDVLNKGPQCLADWDTVLSS
mmetsp:Transcript_9769/g.14570  ORF Transcript_9769/g.14570 Transcript_9769/m.14570 type:complete len:145 (-) Transcript_9769:30-464(-)